MKRLVFILTLALVAAAQANTAIFSATDGIIGYVNGRDISSVARGPVGWTDGKYITSMQTGPVGYIDGRYITSMQTGPIGWIDDKGDWHLNSNWFFGRP